MTDQPSPNRPGQVVPAAEVSPAARQRAVDLLSQQYAHDELTDSDLEARLERVYAATTHAELHAVIADLTVAVPERAVAARPERITAIFSGQERKVTGLAARDFRVRARLGSVELDLRHATFEPGLTTIDLRAVLGYVQLRLPAGVRVESDGHAVAGFFSFTGTKTPEDANAVSTVRITGRALFGFVECIVGGKRKKRDVEV